MGTTRDGNLVKVGSAEHTETFDNIMSMPFADLHELKVLNFKAEVPDRDDGETMEVLFHVEKVTRIANETKFCGSDACMHVGLDGAKYIDGAVCTEDSPCTVEIPTTDDQGRRLFLGEALDWFIALFDGSSSSSLSYAPRCSDGDTEVISDYQPRWEYTSCSCRWRWWNCGDGKAKHVRACQEPGGGRYNLVYETCQRIPDDASPCDNGQQDLGQC